MSNKYYINSAGALEYKSVTGRIKKVVGFRPLKEFVLPLFWNKEHEVKEPKG